MYFIRFILKYFLFGLLIHFLCKKYISTAEERKEKKSKKLQVRNKKTKQLFKIFLVNFLPKAHKKLGVFGIQEG